jgi:hypothetical protein
METKSTKNYTMTEPQTNNHIAENMSSKAQHNDK